MPHNTPLKFIIIGASTAGLVSAIALRASGHEVLVIEKDEELGGSPSIPTGGVRLPPNGCKILFDWGLEAQIRAHAIVGEGFTVYKYEGTDSGRDYLGTNRWDPELLRESRGDFLQIRHRDLIRLLYDTALGKPLKNDSEPQLNGHTPSQPITFEFGAEVVDADFDTCSVTLKSGVVHHGDAIIGADGASGFVRRRLLAEDVAPLLVSGTDDERRGLALYAAIIPKSAAVVDEELSKLYEYPQRNMVTFSMGSNRGAQAFLAGEDEDIVFWVYTPDADEDGSWTQVAEKNITDVVGPCDPLIRRLAALAGPATCVQIKNYYELKSWVSKSGNAVVLGEAAHPFPVVSLHTYSVAIEDGAFIGKLFSHSRKPARVREFMSAFEETRKARCLHIDHSEKQYIDVMALPDGPMQATRDAAMRANEAAGRNVMDAADVDLQQMWDDMRMIFGYDPADDADDWWMSWGRLRDAPSASKEGKLTEDIPNESL
ncbi:FAD-binding-3 domain-containing protein [Favolaschia claudopus]|uniref:FAD-binding-3 domain-containing protein n=1 Tax=Favolaschia claudopus TaxID=2862362 RepID=A0AAV9ZC90_9AGAR